MKLSAAAHRTFQTFFREHLRDTHFQMPPIYFYAGGLTKILTTLFDVHGITLGRHIFIKPSLIKIDRSGQPQISADLAAHEIAHVLQYLGEGFFVFLYRYFSEYRRNLQKFKKSDAGARHQAYLEISFEIEAREIAAEFVEWKTK